MPDESIPAAFTSTVNPFEYLYCVPSGGHCINTADGEPCTNGSLTFQNCPSGGQCCKFGLNATNFLLFTFKK